MRRSRRPSFVVTAAVCGGLMSSRPGTFTYRVHGHAGLPALACAPIARAACALCRAAPTKTIHIIIQRRVVFGNGQQLPRRKFRPLHASGLNQTAPTGLPPSPTTTRTPTHRSLWRLSQQVCDRSCGTGRFGNYNCNWRDYGASCRFCFEDREKALLANDVAKQRGGAVIM